jgi:hypothetical protein
MILDRLKPLRLPVRIENAIWSVDHVVCRQAKQETWRLEWRHSAAVHAADRLRTLHTTSTVLLKTRPSPKWPGTLSDAFIDAYVRRSHPNFVVIM